MAYNPMFTPFADIFPRQGQQAGVGTHLGTYPQYVGPNYRAPNPMGYTVNRPQQGTTPLYNPNWLGIRGLRGPAQQAPGSLSRRISELFGGRSADLPAALGYADGQPYYGTTDTGPLPGQEVGVGRRLGTAPIGDPAPNTYSPIPFNQIPQSYLQQLSGYRFPMAPGQLLWQAAPGGRYEYRDPATGTWTNPAHGPQTAATTAPAATPAATRRAALPPESFLRSIEPGYQLPGKANQLVWQQGGKGVPGLGTADVWAYQHPETGQWRIPRRSGPQAVRNALVQDGLRKRRGRR